MSILGENQYSFKKIFYFLIDNYNKMDSGNFQFEHKKLSYKDVLEQNQISIRRASSLNKK